METVINSILEKTTAYFIEEFDVGSLLVGIISFIIIYCAKQLFSIAKRKYNDNSNFNISGYWITTFDSFMYEGRKIIEIYYFKQSSGDIKLRILHFSDARKDPSKLLGAGKVRNSFISFFYLTTKKTSKVLGTMCLRILSTDVDSITLQGNCYEDYTELDVETQERIHKLQKTNDMLRLCRVKLPLMRRILFRLGCNTYKDYDHLVKGLHKEQ